MSALNILGGVGQGLMQGSQIIAQQEQRKLDNQYRDQQAAMQREAHDAQMEQVNRVKADQELNDWMSEQYRSVHAREDLDEYGKATEYAKAILPRARPEHIELAKKSSDALYQQLGVKGVDALVRGDISVMQRLADAKAPGTRIASEGGNIVVIKPDGAMQILDRSGLLSMLELSKAQEAITAGEAARLDRDGKQAKIDLDRATAGYRNRMPMAGGTGSRSGGGSGAGSRSGGSDEYDPVKALDDYTKAFKGEGLGEDGADWDKGLGLNYFARIRTYNPELLSTEAGQIMALMASRELAKGTARTAPEIGPNGDLVIAAYVGPNKYFIETGVSEQRLMEMKGPDGAPLMKTPEEVGTMYLEAVKKLGLQEPEAFTAAVVASRDPAVMQKARAAAAKGDQGAIRTLQLIPVVSRANTYAASLPVPSGNKSSTPEAERIEFSNAFNSDNPRSPAEQVKQDAIAKRESDEAHKRDVVIPERTRQIESRRFADALRRLRAGGLEPLALSTMIAQIADAGQAVPELMEKLSPAERAEVQKLIEVQNKGSR